MTSRRGEEFELDVFSSTLGCSRAHRFVYSRTRTEDDLIACWLSAIRSYGAAAEQWLTDNMGALVTFSGGRRRSERAWAFAREAGFEIVLCRPGMPETKGYGKGAVM